jgi:hypothetical protein
MLTRQTDIPLCKTTTSQSPTSPRRNSKESSAQTFSPTSGSPEQQSHYVSLTVGEEQQQHPIPSTRSTLKKNPYSPTRRQHSLHLLRNRRPAQPSHNRLRRQQSSDHAPHSIARPAARARRHPRQRDSAWIDAHAIPEHAGHSQREHPGVDGEQPLWEDFATCRDRSVVCCSG